MGLFDKLGKGLLVSNRQDSEEKITKLGYDFVCRGTDDSGMVPAGALAAKDGVIYHCPSKNAFSNDLLPEKMTPIEITGVSEITKDAKLAALDIHYRVNGAISSMKVRGQKNDLLTIADKLGYNG